MQKLKVIIVGAGIGGLTAGIALRQAGHTVEIYDRTRELRPAGAGISLWSNGVKVLNQFGLGAEIARIGGQMNRMEYRTLSGDLLNDVDLMPLIETVGQRPYPVARMDLQAMLLEAYGEPVILNTCCAKVQETEDQVTVYFENGHQTTGDLVIGADGVRSVLRTHVLGEEFQPRYAGYVNWNGLVQASPDLAPPDTWVIYVGDHKRASMMPVSDDRFYFFFDVPMPREQASYAGDIREDLSHYFQDWAAPVQNLIRQLDPAATNRLLIHDVGPLERMVRGRVALLGDAAHATCPDLGQGGCQALEDVLILSQCLNHTNLTVEYALERYERERKQRTTEMVLKARKRADMIHGKDPTVTQQWYQQLAQESPSDVTSAIAKTILGGPLR